jgi:hypothetical protein
MTPRPRLLILSFSNIAADARVLKQVRRFADEYEVTTCGFGPSPDDRVRHLSIPDGLTIDQRDRNDLLLRRYRRMYWSLPGIAHVMSVLPAEPRFDVILANDIDTVGVALALAPVAGVHADIHEYAPRQNDELLLWRVFVAPYVRWMCRRFLKRADSMTTVGSGVAAEYRRVFGLTPGIVTNAAPFANLEVSPVGTPIRLVHSGAALRNRHLDVTVQAVLDSTADITLDLFLMPNDPAYIEELRAMAGDGGRVVVREPLPYAQLIAALNAYDVGIHVIPPTNFNNRWSLPNKFFDYVQARLALVIGPSAEMRRVLEDNGLGVVADGFRADDVRRVLDSLTPEIVAAGKAAAGAAARPLSAESQVEVWAGAIADLAARIRPAG